MHRHAIQGTPPCGCLQRLAAALAQSAQDGVFTQLPGLFPQVFVEAPPYGRREDLAVLIACVLKNEL